MKSLALFILLCSFTAAFSQSPDTLDYRKASAVKDAAERLIELERFVAAHPESKYLPRAYDNLFELYADKGENGKAVAAASASIAHVPVANRMSSYNRFAYALAKKGFGLDSALVWIDNAIATAEATKSRSLAGYQDSKAYVLYKQGKPKEAEQLQRIAIKGNEQDPEMLGNLATFEHANGKRKDALKTLTKALYYGGEQDLRDLFIRWTEELEPSPRKREAAVKKIVTPVLKSIVDTLKGEKLVAARSTAAGVMAGVGVDIPTAKKWAEEAVRTLTQSSSVSDLVAYKQNLAAVMIAQGKTREALVVLRSIEDFMSPYDQSFWKRLGDAYVATGELQKAASAYMNGLLTISTSSLREALEDVYNRLHGSKEGIEKELDSLREAGAEFHPGSYGSASFPNGKVVLAELFTGADCGPCASSDVAFDKLIEYYPRTAVAVLEYHVHVPGPDPMTVDESYDRYSWYGGQGTPTAVFDGREHLIGGGPRLVAKNRFGVYRHAIKRFEQDDPGVNISVSAKMERDIVTVDVVIADMKANAGKPVLHIALAERSVDYTGSNGISKHAYVVRRLLDRGEGMALTGTGTISKSVNVGEVEASIKAYLDNPTVQRSWTTRRQFTGWRSRPDTIDRRNLSVIAWVQDAETKEVLQASYTTVPASLGLK